MAKRGTPVLSGDALEGTIWKVVRKCVPAAVIRMEQLHNAWEEIATKRLAPHVWPASIDGPTLVLHVKDSNWLHELSYLKTDLRRRIRAHDPDVHALVFRVASSASTRGVADRADVHTQQSQRAELQAPESLTTDDTRQRAWLHEALSTMADNAQADDGVTEASDEELRDVDALK